jgi:hypothetical protein
MTGIQTVKSLTGLPQLTHYAMLPMHTDLAVMLDESGIMAGQKALLSAIVGGQSSLTDQLRLQTVHDLVAVHLMGFVQAF